MPKERTLSQRAKTLTILASFALSIAIGIRSFACTEDIFENEYRYSNSSGYGDEKFAKEEKRLLANEANPERRESNDAPVDLEALGKFYINNGAPEKANRWLNRLIAYLELNQETGSEYIRALLLSSKAACMSGQYPEALEICRRAVKLAESNRYEDDLVSIPLHLHYAFLLTRAKQYAEAERALNHCLALSRKSKRFEKEVQFAFARLYLATGRYEQAASVYRQVADLHKRDFSSDYISALLNLAETRLLMNQEAACMAACDECLHSLHQEGVLDDRAATKAGLLLVKGTAEGKDTKMLQQSQSDLMHSVQFYSDIFGKQSPYLFSSLRELVALRKQHPGLAATSKGVLQKLEEEELMVRGNNLLLAGDIGQAKVTLDKALQLNESKWGARNPYTAEVQIMLGMIDQLNNDLNSAEKRYSEALSVYEQAYGNEDYELLPVLNLLTQVQNQAKLKTAETTGTRGLTLARTLYQKGNIRVAPSFELMGDIYAREGQHLQSLNMYRKAMRMLAQEFNPPVYDLQRLSSKIDQL